MDPSLQQTIDPNEAKIDQFYKDARNPATDLIAKTLENMRVFIWGSFIASDEILNTNNEPSLSTRDIARMDEAEGNWLYENIEGAVEEGKEFEVIKKDKSHDIKLSNSRLYPVDDATLQVVEMILNTFDAFPMANEVWNTSYFKHNLEHAFDYQSLQMEDWEEQYCED